MLRQFPFTNILVHRQKASVVYAIFHFAKVGNCRQNEVPTLYIYFPKAS